MSHSQQQQHPHRFEDYHHWSILSTTGAAILSQILLRRALEREPGKAIVALGPAATGGLLLTYRRDMRPEAEAYSETMEQAEFFAKSVFFQKDGANPRHLPLSRPQVGMVKTGEDNQRIFLKTPTAAILLLDLMSIVASVAPNVTGVAFKHAHAGATV
ncbi:hypothetical protein JCM11641_001053 [Rhodosporidiobolus odoratus]